MAKRFDSRGRLKSSDLDNDAGNPLYKKALQYAFLLLKYRPRSKAEIVKRLNKKSFSSGIIEEVLDYLQRKRYIDDVQFAKIFAESGREKGWGPLKIVFRLKKFGVSALTIEDSIGDRNCYFSCLLDLVDKRSVRYQGPNQYQRMVRFLKARGFYNEDIIQALNEKGVTP